jgi:hypothetical protein
LETAIIDVSLYSERRRNFCWCHFENQASEQGQFGGIVNSSVCDELMSRLRR